MLIVLVCLHAYVVVGRWRDSYLYGHFAPPNLSFSSYIHPGKGFLGEQLSAYLRRQQLRPDHALCPGMDVVHEYLDVVDVVEDRGSGMYNTDYPVFNIEKAPTETQIATVGVVEGKSTHRPLTRSHGMTGTSLVVRGCPPPDLFSSFDFFFCYHFFDFGYCELIEKCF